MVNGESSSNFFLFSFFPFCSQTDRQDLCLEDALCSSLLLPPRSFLPHDPSSSLLFPRPISFLHLAHFSSSFLPHRSLLHFDDSKYYLNHLESVKIYFSPTMTKALPTEQPTNPIISTLHAPCNMHHAPCSAITSYHNDIP